MDSSQLKIERMYQRAMNLRDSTWHSVNMEPIENEYTSQYMRAIRRTHDVKAFQQQTREYRALLWAYKKLSLVEKRGE